MPPSEGTPSPLAKSILQPLGLRLRRVYADELGRAGGGDLGLHHRVAGGGVGAHWDDGQVGRRQTILRRYERGRCRR